MSSPRRTRGSTTPAFQSSPSESVKNNGRKQLKNVTKQTNPDPYSFPGSVGDDSEDFEVLESSVGVQKRERAARSAVTSAAGSRSTRAHNGPTPTELERTEALAAKEEDARLFKILQGMGFPDAEIKHMGLTEKKELALVASESTIQEKHSKSSPEWQDLPDDIKKSWAPKNSSHQNPTFSTTHPDNTIYPSHVLENKNPNTKINSQNAGSCTLSTGYLYVQNVDRNSTSNISIRDTEWANGQCSSKMLRNSGENQAARNHGIRGSVIARTSVGSGTEFDAPTHDCSHNGPVWHNSGRSDTLQPPSALDHSSNMPTSNRLAEYLYLGKQTKKKSDASSKPLSVRISIGADIDQLQQGLVIGNQRSDEARSLSEQAAVDQSIEEPPHANLTCKSEGVGQSHGDSNESRQAASETLRSVLVAGQSSSISSSNLSQMVDLTVNTRLDGDSRGIPMEQHKPDKVVSTNPDHDVNTRRSTVPSYCIRDSDGIRNHDATTSSTVSGRLSRKRASGAEALNTSASNLSTQSSLRNQTFVVTNVDARKSTRPGVIGVTPRGITVSVAENAQPTALHDALLRGESTPSVPSRVSFLTNSTSIYQQQLGAQKQPGLKAVNPRQLIVGATPRRHSGATGVDGSQEDLFSGSSENQVDLTLSEDDDDMTQELCPLDEGVGGGEDVPEKMVAVKDHVQQPGSSVHLANHSQTNRVAAAAKTTAAGTTVIATETRTTAASAISGACVSEKLDVPLQSLYAEACELRRSMPRERTARFQPYGPPWLVFGPDNKYKLKPGLIDDVAFTQQLLNIPDDPPDYKYPLVLYLSLKHIEKLDSEFSRLQLANKKKWMLTRVSWKKNPLLIPEELRNWVAPLSVTTEKDETSSASDDDENTWPMAGDDTACGSNQMDASRNHPRKGLSHSQGPSHSQDLSQSQGPSHSQRPSHLHREESELAQIQESVGATANASTHAASAAVVNGSSKTSSKTPLLVPAVRKLGFAGSTLPYKIPKLGACGQQDVERGGDSWTRAESEHGYENEMYGEFERIGQTNLGEQGKHEDDDLRNITKVYASMQNNSNVSIKGNANFASHSGGFDASKGSMGGGHASFQKYISSTQKVQNDCEDIFSGKLREHGRKKICRLPDYDDENDNTRSGQSGRDATDFVTESKAQRVHKQQAPGRVNCATGRGVKGRGNGTVRGGKRAQGVTHDTDADALPSLAEDGGFAPFHGLSTRGRKSGSLMQKSEAQEAVRSMIPRDHKLDCVQNEQDGSSNESFATAHPDNEDNPEIDVVTSDDDFNQSDERKENAMKRGRSSSKTRRNPRGGRAGARGGGVVRKKIEGAGKKTAKRRTPKKAADENDSNSNSNNNASYSQPAISNFMQRSLQDMPTDLVCNPAQNVSDQQLDSNFGSQQAMTSRLLTTFSLNEYEVHKLEGKYYIFSTMIEEEKLGRPVLQKGSFICSSNQLYMVSHIPSPDHMIEVEILPSVFVPGATPSPSLTLARPALHMTSSTSTSCWPPQYESGEVIPLGRRGSVEDSDSGGDRGILSHSDMTDANYNGSSTAKRRRMT